MFFGVVFFPSSNSFLAMFASCNAFRKHSAHMSQANNRQSVSVGDIGINNTNRQSFLYEASSFPSSSSSYSPSFSCFFLRHFGSNSHQKHPFKFSNVFPIVFRVLHVWISRFRHSQKKIENGKPSNDEVRVYISVHRNAIELL